MNIPTTVTIKENKGPFLYFTWNLYVVLSLLIYLLLFFGGGRDGTRIERSATGGILAAAVFDFSSLPRLVEEITKNNTENNGTSFQNSDVILLIKNKNVIIFGPMERVKEPCHIKLIAQQHIYVKDA